MLNKWDKRFVDLAFYIAEWSKDKSRKVGAVIVDNRKTIVSLGYNGFPRGVDDEVEERYERPLKYYWTQHAEVNAIYNADRNLDGCSIYVTLHPCSQCMGGIINAGISRLVCPPPDTKHHKYGEDFEQAMEMLSESIEHQYFII